MTLLHTLKILKNDFVKGTTLMILLDNPSFINLPQVNRKNLQY